MRRTDFLEQKSLDGYVASRKLARNGKNLININKLFPKGPFSLSVEKRTLYLSSWTNIIKPERT